VKQRGLDVSQWLRVGGVKAYADGSLGSGTALFHQVNKRTTHLMAPLDVFTYQKTLSRFLSSGVQMKENEPTVHT
jgi:predicted amidohydrolase YtcJ